MWNMGILTSCCSFLFLFGFVVLIYFYLQGRNLPSTVSRLGRKGLPPCLSFSGRNPSALAISCCLPADQQGSWIGHRGETWFWSVCGKLTIVPYRLSLRNFISPRAMVGTIFLLGIIWMIRTLFMLHTELLKIILL